MTTVAVGTPFEDLSKGTKVWIPHEEHGWVSGVVINPIDANQVVTTVDDDEDHVEKAYPATQLFIQNPTILEGVEDMTTLSFLHEPAILHNMAKRYETNTIYTYTGSILIAVNPYRKLNIYSKDMIDAYCGQPLGRLSPHVYAIAENAYRSMLTDETNQSILVSGESGAGKTETTKFLLQYFAAMGNRESRLPTSPKPDDSNVEKRVLESTPLLEAFGNAKTLKNDNSSRFGKFIEIQFDQGVIIGAKIRTYLLEKSRIVRQTTNERGYHIFYQLTKGCSPVDSEELHIAPASEYVYLNQSGCLDVEDVSDEDQFLRTKEAMEVVGITAEEKKSIFTVISAILRLGNIAFAPGSQTDSSAVTDQEPLKLSAQLLSCDAKLLEKYLTTKHILAGNESYDVLLTPEQALSTRDALSMLLYSRLFDWLVNRINVSIQAKKEAKSFIGVLDIYGFETFETNSFEQFCINYANEKLQQQFNQYIFKIEQKEYEKEKIDWSYINFNDNQECLDLLEKKPICVLSLLDEESKFPKANAGTFCQKLTTNFAGSKKHPYFQLPRFGKNQFTVVHYAGQVTYSTEGFIEKNKDFIVPEHISLLEKSGNKFVASLFAKFWASQGAQGGKGGQFVSVGSQFRDSLGELMKSILATSPNYIRCIKPNQQKKPNKFDKLMVLQQLRCGGVLECIRISKAGYPTRRAYPSFVTRYSLLSKNIKRKDPRDPKITVGILLTDLGIPKDAYQLGLTKIFLRAGQIAKFEKMRTDLMNQSATHIQKHWKGILQKRKYSLLKKVTIRTQSGFRTFLAVALLRKIREKVAATKIQKTFRMFVQKKKLRNIKKGAIAIQSAIRKRFASQELSDRQREAAALFLQKIVRSIIARKEYFRLKRATVLAQARWRGKLARRLYSEMRIEARSIQRIVEEKTQLEKKVEELSWKFTAEIKIRNKMELERSQLEKKVEDSKVQLETVQVELKKEKEDLKKELEEIKKNLKDELKLKEQLQVEKEELSKNLSGLEGSSEEQKKLAASTQLEIEELSKQFEEEKKTLQDQLESEVSNLKVQLEKVEKEKEELKAKLAEAEKTISSLKSDVKKLTPPPMSSHGSQTIDPSRRPDMPSPVPSPATAARAIANSTDPPEIIFRQIARNVAGDQDKGDHQIVDFLVTCILSKYEDKTIPAFFVAGNSNVQVPMPAFVAVKTFLKNRRVEGTALDYLVHTVEVVSKKYHGDSTMLSFWLANAIILLHHVSDKDVINIPSITQGIPLTRNATLTDRLRHLVAFIYCTILDDVYQTLKPLIAIHLDETTGSPGSPRKSVRSLNKHNMKDATDQLTELLHTLQASHLPTKIIQQFFGQVFYYINSQIFNDIMLRRDLCTLSSGMEYKMRLSSIVEWAKKPENREFTAAATKELEPVRELASVLVVNKEILAMDEVRKEVCPNVKGIQLKQILSNYQPDDSFEEPISPAIVQAVVKSPEYNVEDQLLWNTTAIHPVSVKDLPDFKMEEINFPREIQVEFEGLFGTGERGDVKGRSGSDLKGKRFYQFWK